MTGRITYFMIAGVAIAAGMVMQGDIRLGDRADGTGISQILIGPDEREIDRTVDRAVDRVVDRAADQRVRREERQIESVDPAAGRALAEAVAEFAHAEGSLIAARLDDLPAEAVRQAEQRRDFAKEAVDRISKDIKAERRQDRALVRENAREPERDAPRN